MKRKIGLGCLHEGLYHLQLASVCSFQSSTTNNLWHYRLGHVSFARLKMLAQKFPFITCSNNVACTICPQAKQTCLCFPSSSIKTSKPFQVIHCNICGPFSLPSHLNARFFLSIVDDYSRATWIYIMNVKSETIKILQSFFSMVHNQFHLKISSLISGIDDIDEHFNDTQVFRSDDGT